MWSIISHMLSAEYSNKTEFCPYFIISISLLPAGAGRRFTLLLLLLLLNCLFCLLLFLLLFGRLADCGTGGGGPNWFTLFRNLLFLPLFLPLFRWGSAEVSLITKIIAKIATVATAIMVYP